MNQGRKIQDGIRLKKEERNQANGKKSTIKKRGKEAGKNVRIFSTKKGRKPACKKRERKQGRKQQL